MKHNFHTVIQVKPAPSKPAPARNPFEEQTNNTDTTNPFAEDDQGSEQENGDTQVSRIFLLTVILGITFFYFVASRTSLNMNKIK